MSIKVLGTGSYLPAKVLTNNDIAQIVDTSDEWIRTRTGIERRHVLQQGETVTQMAQRAAENALANAKVSAADIDFILCATSGGDYIIPTVASLVQAAIGATCPAMDINTACSGFLYALEAASGLLALERAKKILLIAAEGLSRSVNWADRATCVLFGDAAAAVVLEKGHGLLSMQLQSNGCAEPLYIPFPQGNAPWRAAQNDASYVHMQGQEVYKFAVSTITSGITAALASAAIQPGEVAHVMVHQANLRIIDAAKRKLAIPAERFHINIQEVGNTSAASIPLLLDDANRNGQLHQNDILVLSGFGAGLSSGAAVLRWGV